MISSWLSALAKVMNYRKSWSWDWCVIFNSPHCV